MVGNVVTTDKGEPVDGNGKSLAQSSYTPPKEVIDLFAKCQADYQVAYSLQHRNFDEFDGISLLQRANLDQQTFGAFVGAEYVPQHRQWRWKGRKNTARNKLMGITAHMLSAMLFPYVRATNESDEEDKMAARVMGIMVEEHLRRAKYDYKFLYLILSALVNPAAFVQVEYVEAIQRVKQKLADGSVQIIEAVDEILSGMKMHLIPVDEILLADFYTENLQEQPYIVRARRISWDSARSIYGKHKDFKYVEAGKTKIVLTGQENQTIYDIAWTEADQNFVQELTFYYRPEDLEVTWVGGVFMGNEEDVYNTNPFKHRRISISKDGPIKVPIYPYAKTGFEPIDPTGRFAYFKSGAFKEFWDDDAQNRIERALVDGTLLEVIKPLFLSGVAKADGTVIVPGATIAMPQGAKIEPYSISSNLAAAYNAVNQAKEDMSDSTQSNIMTGSAESGVTAYATQQAEQNARVFLGNFGVMIARIVEDVGALTVDIILQNGTVGDIDASVPEAIGMKYKTYLARGKERGKEVTNKIIFTDKYMGREFTEEEQDEIEWNLFDKAGGKDSDQRIFEVNPYLFAKNRYALYVDADQIVQKSMGTDQQRSTLALQVLTSPAVAPYVDMEAVVEEFAIEPFADGDPDRFKKKGNVNDMMGAVMGQQMPGMPNQIPTQSLASKIPQ